MTTNSLRQTPKKAGRPDGAPWRTASNFPLFEVFRGEYINDVSKYSRPYLRQMAVGRTPIPDRLVITMQKQTGWTVERLFGAEFLGEWRVDHKNAK